MRLRRLCPLLLLAVLTVAGCTVQDAGDIAAPGLRNVKWFSYLNGDDLRRQCDAMSPDRARLVYNGRFLEQVRTYDLTGRGDGAVLAGRVFRGPAVLTVTEGEGLGLARGHPWDRGLDAARAERLWAALERAGAFEPSPRLTLEGREVWWLAVGCRQGEVFFHAWEAGRPDFPDQIFRPLLEVMDPTGIAFAPVRPNNNPEILWDKNEAQQYRFRVEAAPGGLLYH